MTSLSAIPGYQELLQQAQATNARAQELLAQSKAARESGNTQLADQLQDEAVQLSTENQSTIDQLTNLREQYANSDLASPTVTTGQSQSTPPENARDDGPTQAPTSGGVGAGTSPNAFDSRGPDNTPPASRNANQQAINTAFANQTIAPRPNVLDQYASYTYAISWWLLTPEQYNNLGAAGRRAPAPGTGSWTLLIQSGGAPIAGRSQFFPDDFYFDDLEINSQLAGKGTGLSNNAMDIRFKVVEPNGLTLIQRLFEAVSFAYKNPSPPASRVADANVGFGPTVSANQTSQGVPNYVAAQYCLTIEFYGYDSQGNLVAPATGSSGTGPQAVIKKYYPFLLRNISFRTVANQVEYMIEAVPVVYDIGTGQARGTIPFQFALAGTTVSQLLQGGPLPVSANNSGQGRTSGPNPNTGVDTLINAGIEQDKKRAQVDQNGNFTGDTTSPFNIVAP
jgi:hypothetical protein